MLRPNIGFFGTVNLLPFRLQKLNTTQPYLLYMLKSETFYITQQKISWIYLDIVALYLSVPRVQRTMAIRIIRRKFGNRL